MGSTLEKVYLGIIKLGVYSLFFVPLLVTKDYFFPYIFGKAIVLRIIIEIIAGVFILLVLLNKKYEPKKTALFWGVVLYMAIKGITTLTGINPYHSFWSNYERMEGFLTLIHFGILFVIMAGVFRSKEDWKWVLRTAVFGGFLVALVGIGQKLNLDFIVHSGATKVDSTIGNSSYVAAYLIYSAFILLYLFFKDKNLYWRIPYIIILLTDALVIFFTVSRGGVLGLFGGLIVLSLLVLFLMPKNVIETKYKYGAAAILIFFLALGITTFASRNQEWVQKNYILRKLTTISLTNRTIQDRIINLKISWHGFKERFFTGYGMENYYVPFNKYYNSKTSEPWFDRAHNIIADQAVTSGIFGLLAYLFLVFGAIYYLCKERGRDYLTSFIFVALIIASFFANLFVFDNSSTYTMFFMVLAFVSFLTRKPESAIETIKERLSFFGKMAGKLKITREGAGGPVSIFVPLVLVLVLGFSLYFFNIRPATANSRAIEAYKYSKVNYEQSEKIFQEAMAFGTFGNAEIALRAGDLAAGVFDEEKAPDKAKSAMEFAAEAMAKAIKQEPLNARLYFYLGNLYVNYFFNFDKTETNFKRALDNLNQARQLSPNRQEIYYTTAQLMLGVGRTEEAIDNMKRAREINIDPLSSYNLLIAYLYAGKDYQAQAEEIFNEIYKTNTFGVYEGNEIEKLVNVYYGRDDFEAVIKILNQFIEKKQGEESQVKIAAKYHGKLAALYKEAGDKEKAREHAIKAGELDPEVETAVEEFLRGL